MRRRAMRRGWLALGVVLCGAPLGAQSVAWRVGPGERFARVSDAIAAAPAFTRVIVEAGTYREGTLSITRPLQLVGEPGAILDGQGGHTVLLVQADDVSVEGLTFANTGASQVEERAGLKVRLSRRCRIARNTFIATAFGVYLEKTVGCEVTGNDIRGTGRGQMSTGNGIHAWYSDSVIIRDNHIREHRDGIYFEFVKGGRVEGNVSEHSARYGMHFMFSDDCRYERNTYRVNGNGVAVMYSRGVTMVGNTFEQNWGSAAYGLLLKDINDSHVSGNRFLGNSVGLYLEDAGRNDVRDNTFRGNGWALKVMASAQGNTFEGNTFERNAFDVGTNSRSNYSTFRGNYWDRYAGYDLNRDGVGDVPHFPVRLFALIVEQSPASLVLLRSLLVDLLDLAERALPALTPAEMLDASPRLTPAPGAPR
jgi:nitrous oxidase accessory protein